MTDDNGCILPGNVYEYHCDNDQGYGYMVPVRTSDGWDFVDTYHLDIPVRKLGETSDEASVRRITELGLGEHDGYVNHRLSGYYHHNASLHNRSVPCGLTLAFNVNDYDVVPRRRASDFDYDDVVTNVPMYREQHFDWDSGTTRGLCFVRKGAKRDARNEFEGLCSDAMRSFVMPCTTEMAARIIEKASEKLRELEGRGLATPRDRAYLSHVARRERIVAKCCEDLANESRECVLEVQEARHGK
nr:MAG TPA: hypothetical protein [Caudoviricetes sp.]